MTEQIIRFRMLLFLRSGAGERTKHWNFSIDSVVEGEVKKHIVRDVKKASKELLGAVKSPKLAGFKNIVSLQRTASGSGSWRIGRKNKGRI